MSVPARRFRKRQAVLLDDGARLRIDADGQLPEEARVVTLAGTVRKGSTDDQARDQPAQGTSTAGRRVGRPLRRTVRLTDRRRSGPPFYRGEADEVHVGHRVVGLPTRCGCVGSARATCGR